MVEVTISNINSSHLSKGLVKNICIKGMIAVFDHNVSDLIVSQMHSGISPFASQYLSSSLRTKECLIQSSTFTKKIETRVQISSILAIIYLDPTWPPPLATALAPPPPPPLT
jgi:hypothetical protein